MTLHGAMFPWAAIGLLLGAVACQEPTQIRLEISADASCQDIVATSISVGTPADVESRAAVAEHEGCEGGKVGTLVLIPSGEPDEEISVRIVAGLGKTPAACVADGFKKVAASEVGCIVARRTLRFEPNETVVVSARLSAACLDKPCSAGSSCELGQCVP